MGFLLEGTHDKAREMEAELDEEEEEFNEDDKGPRMGQGFNNSNAIRVSSGLHKKN